MGKKAAPSDAPLVVDKKTTRLWALIDPKDGTLVSVNVCSEIDRGSSSHDEVVLYTSAEIANRAAAVEMLNNAWRVEPCEVIVLRGREAR